MYTLTEKGLSVIKKYINAILNQWKICQTMLLAGAPILLVLKRHGRSLQLCVYYPGLNKITMMNPWPQHSMIKLWDSIQGARIFTKNDLKAGFHHIWVKEGDEWKTTFHSRYGLYEFTVRQFGLTNAPVTFEDAMETILRYMLSGSLLIYMDKVSIYSATEEEHTQILLEVNQQLQETNLAIAPDKWVWHASRVEFLGIIISSEETEMALDKIETILEWPTCECQ